MTSPTKQDQCADAESLPALAFKGTKGPWAVEWGTASDGYASICSDQWFGFARVVVRMNGDERNSPEGEANARLIAAAPELLAASQEIFRTGLDEETRHGDQRQAVAMLRAAIARALGSEPAQ